MRKKHLTPRQREALRKEIVKKYNELLSKQPTQKQIDGKKAFVARLKQEVKASISPKDSLIDELAHSYA